MYSLDEIVQFPPLQLGVGAVGNPTVQTATQQAVWRAWIVEADKVCFGALTRAAAVKVKAKKGYKRHADKVPRLLKAAHV